MSVEMNGLSAGWCLFRTVIWADFLLFLNVVFGDDGRYGHGDGDGG